MLHFHCFHSENCVAFLNLITFLHKNFWDCPRHWCYSIPGCSFFKLVFLEIITLKFIRYWITMGIEQINWISRSMELNLSNLIVDDHMQLIFAEFRILELIFVIANGCNSSIFIIKLSHYTKPLLPLQESFLNIYFMLMSCFFGIPKIHQFRREFCLLTKVVVSGNYCTNQIIMVSNLVLLE